LIISWIRYISIIISLNYKPSSICYIQWIYVFITFSCSTHNHSLTGFNSTNNIINRCNNKCSCHSLANLSANGVFVNNGTYLFEANILGGYLGIFTGVKKGAFAMSIDARSDNLSIWENVYYFIMEHAYPVGYLMR